MSKKKVPTFVCPEVSFPKDIIKRNVLKKSVVTESKLPLKRVRSQDDDNIEDIKSIYESIKNFNAEVLKGKERLKIKQDKLTELGAPPPKQQKVPFKTKMAQLRRRQKREEEIKETLKESSQVLASKYLKQKKVNNKKKLKSTGHDSIQPKIGMKTKNGVFYMKKDKK